MTVSQLALLAFVGTYVIAGIFPDVPKKEQLIVSLLMVLVVYYWNDTHIQIWRKIKEKFSGSKHN